MNLVPGRPVPSARVSLAGVLAASALVLSACGGGGGSGSTADSASGDSAGSGSAFSSRGSASSSSASGGQAAAEPAAKQATDVAAVVPDDSRSVISTGYVEVTSKDVAGARDDARALVLARKGFLADERTRTDGKGRTTRSDLTLRVPSASFDTAMGELTDLGRLVSSKRTAEDVTTEVIDVQQRIRAQQVGLQRLEQLMSRAGTLSNLLAVENEVTDRQAELDSLKARQTYLDGQTSLSTIHLTVVRSVPPPVVHHAGFLGGLENGWAALAGLVRAALVTLGAVLPFAVIALLLFFPVRLLVRRVRRGAVVAPAPETS